jgi:nickel-type superoxide dismutase maturation protease
MNSYSCVHRSWTLQAHPVYTQGMPRLPRCLLARLPVARFVVADSSMQPALRPGDRVLVSRWSRPRPGHIVMLRDPEHPSQTLAKRLAARTADGMYMVRGDNPNVSRDSRTFGPVPRRLIIGVVFWRYLPAERRGATR